MIPLQDTIHARNPALATWGLILVNVLCFLYEMALPPEARESFLASAGMVPARLSVHPETWWTLLSCMFLHGGWMHLIGNMWMLYLFGDNVEDRMGSARYFLFYLLCGIAAGLVHFYSDPTSTLPTIGASGAIAGVLGAYFALFPAARVITLVPILFIPFFFEIPAVIFLGLWFVGQIFSGTLSSTDGEQGGVAWWAHVGGFATGLILLWVFKKRKRTCDRQFADEYYPW